MTDVTMASELGVTLVRTNATDEFPIQMAQASLGKDATWELAPTIDPARFLRALVDPRHGVPFEHDIWTFFVEVPIFVARQWVKHRHASMNEMSGRYVKLMPKFYTMPDGRPLINQGSKMKPILMPASDDKVTKLRASDLAIAQQAWDEYEYRLSMGAAEEYARIILPVNVYTQFYWSVNTRALMSFLERRVDSIQSRVPSHPQWEIDCAATVIEDYFEQHMPLTHRAFVAAGRVAP